MPEITSELVKELREATNLGMMECKRALVEAEGDKEKAIRLLRERGMVIAQKKASRTANQGLIASKVGADGKVGSLIEVNCETDFVARNESFIAFVGGMAERACGIDGNLADVAGAELTAKVAEIGENLVLRRNIRYSVQGKGAVASYIHQGGKIGVLIEVGCEKDESPANPIFQEAVKDVLMHIAASAPGGSAYYLDPGAVPADVIAAERAIYAKQVEGKPANIVDKIVDGKIRKFYTQVCLLEQEFVKEPKLSVKAYLAARGKELGDTLTVRRFARYQLGEQA